MSWSTFPFVLTSESLIYAFRYAGGSSPGNTSACLSCSLSLPACPSVCGRRKLSPVHPPLHGPLIWASKVESGSEFVPVIEVQIFFKCIYPDPFQCIDCKNTLDLFWDWTLPNAFKPFGFTDANSLRVLCTCHLPFSSSLCVLPFLLYVLSSSTLLFYFGGRWRGRIWDGSC